MCGEWQGDGFIQRLGDQYDPIYPLRTYDGKKTIGKGVAFRWVMKDLHKVTLLLASSVPDFSV